MSDHDPDPGTLYPASDADSLHSLIDWSLGRASPVKELSLKSVHSLLSFTAKCQFMSYLLMVKNFDKRKWVGLKVQWAGLHTVGLPKPVLLKSNKLTIVTDKMKPFNLYISNRYKYVIINNDS